MIKKRRDDENGGKGLLGVLIEFKDEKLPHLSDSQVADNIIGVIFAAHDTTASVLTWTLKYLFDNGNLLESVTVQSSKLNDRSPTAILSLFGLESSFLTEILTMQREQEDIQRRIVKQGRGLTWEDTRMMAFTSRVYESLDKSFFFFFFGF